jgi:AraC-like DNA-binding protein
MSTIPLSDFEPHLIYSMYWPRKDKFLYYEDRCTEWTVFAVENGSFYYELEGENGTATFGDLVICPAKTMLRRVVITPLTFFVLRLRWNDLNGQAADPGTNNDFTGKISLHDTNRLSANYAKMRRAEALDEKRKMQLHNHYTQDLWLLYAEELETICGSAAEPPVQKQPDPAMTKAAMMIQKKAYRSFDLKEIAEALGFSPVRFSQKFKSDFGVNPLQYLTSLRLEKAKSLLLETNLTLDQIAECIGYQNGYYLSRIFMKHLQMSPSIYRKTHRV